MCGKVTVCKVVLTTETNDRTTAEFFERVSSQTEWAKEIFKRVTFTIERVKAFL